MIDQQQIEQAAALIRQGRLVAFPTETVYGLGANALDAAAVARIFEVKERPSTVPLIVHVASVKQARELAAEWPEAATVLASRYWPGPLTLVLRKKPIVPDIVTSGIGTVGLRMPAHPLAQALIAAARLPIAAPSANRFTQLSPTTAAHVRDGFPAGAVDMILDGGPTAVGIESTVLSLAGERPVLFRPGVIPLHEIEELIGPVESVGDGGKGSHPSPGMHPKHYSPRTRVVLIRDGVKLPEGRGAYLALSGTAPAGCEAVTMPATPRAYAAALYATLHRLDREGLDWIAVQLPPPADDWAGVLDRLTRAAAEGR